MIKTTAFLFLSCVFLSYVSLSQDFSEEYQKIRLQNINLTSDELEADYPRPVQFYYKGFSSGPIMEDIHYLDSAILKLELTHEELNLLQENLFFVTERLSYQSFGEAYHTVYSYDLPVFVTTDAVLYALHMSYSTILKTVEREIMATNLEVFLKSLYDNFSDATAKYGQAEQLQDGLKDADIYITIAYSLITDQLQEPHVADRQMIQNLWEAIHAEKMTSMPLFTFPDRNRRLDFSQFKIRGHYVFTELEERQGLKSLEPYFRAMMWLGRIDFMLTSPPENPWEKGWTDAEIQRMHYGAFIVNELLQQSPQLEKLNFNETVINYLVGESDNLTPGDYTSALQSEGINSAARLTDLGTFRKLKEALTSDPDLSQKIMSNLFFADPSSEKPGELPVSYKVSGQRFIFDSFILGNVVFDRIIFEGAKVKRMMPDPLDAMFVLGNNDALPVLQEELDKYPYAGQLSNLRYLADKKPAGFWRESLYNVWLNSIRKLNPKKEPRQPLFMKTAAWHQQKINTQLASWSHLRHDNLLYAKQSYTSMAGCSFPYSYVEPYPEFFRNLKQFADDAAAFFSQINVAEYDMRRVINFFPDFSDVMGKLEILAQKQLERNPFSEEENEWLQSMLFRQMGSGMPPYSGWYINLFFNHWDASRGDLTIVDVHTQPTDEYGNNVGKVLHTGVGKINLGIFVAPSPINCDEYMAFIGPVMSYYEMVTEQYRRLTDQDWEQMVKEQQLPERPEWTNIYLADNRGSAKKAGVHLPYHFYTRISEIPGRVNPTISVYPNPVTDVLHLTFHTGSTTAGQVDIYNLTGKLVKATGKISLSAGNNTVDIRVNDLPEGIYITKLTVGHNMQAVKIIKK